MSTAEISPAEVAETDVVDSSYCGKRKVEEDCESAEEDCESSDEEDEESESSMETDDEESEPETEPVWGYDSFEDKDYCSLSESEFPEDISELESLKPYIVYQNQVHSSRGFQVDSVPDDLLFGHFPINLANTFYGWPNSPDKTAGGYMELMVELALKKYNQTEGLDVKMEYVVRAVACLSRGTKCYITFMARETPNGPLVEYQAKTEWKMRQIHTYPIFCRPSPPPVDLKEKSRRSRSARPQK